MPEAVLARDRIAHRRGRVVDRRQKGRLHSLRAAVERGGDRGRRAQQRGGQALGARLDDQRVRPRGENQRRDLLRRVALERGRNVAEAGDGACQHDGVKEEGGRRGMKR